MSDPFKSKEPPAYIPLQGVEDSIDFRDEETIVARVAYVDYVTKTLWLHRESVVKKNELQ